ncbi:MAG: hypothetical protein M3394_02965 [Actinomycetota bacterium]|nr:hypothetical protein [Actinomycetota bacterium]
MADLRHDVETQAAALKSASFKPQQNTDIGGCIAGAGDVFASRPGIRRVVLVASDLVEDLPRGTQPNWPTTPVLQGAIVRAIYFPCASETVCTQTKQQFIDRATAAGAGDVDVFSAGAPPLLFEGIA